MDLKRKHNSSCTARIKAESRSKITEHLLNRGHQELFDVTPSMVLYWWRLLNNAVFDGKLTPPKKIICRNFRDGSLGWCDPQKDKQVIMGIRRQQIDREAFITVLVHEMVHQYEWIKYGRMSHGNTFHIWRDRIARNIGLPLGMYVE